MKRTEHEAFAKSDMAISHYANVVQDQLKSQNIECVPKSENPLNVPQERQIERYWALCKS